MLLQCECIVRLYLTGFIPYSNLRPPPTYFSSLTSPHSPPPLFPSPLPPSDARYQRPDWNPSSTVTFTPLICIFQPDPINPKPANQLIPPLPQTVTTVMVMQPPSHSNDNSSDDEDHQVQNAPRSLSRRSVSLIFHSSASACFNLPRYK